MSRAGPSTITPADPAQLRGTRQVAAPTRRIDPGSLLDHDDIAAAGPLRPRSSRDGVTRRPAIVGLELDRHDAAGNAAVGREPLNAQRYALEPELVQRIGYRARVEAAQSCREHHPCRLVTAMVRARNVRLYDYVYAYCQYAKHIALPVPASER